MNLKNICSRPPAFQRQASANRQPSRLKKFLAALSIFALTSSSASAADYALGAFFSSDADTNLQLYRSSDMIHMDHLFCLNEIAGRDPSLRYYNGAFYICLVEPDRTFKIMRSNDLIDWTTAAFNVIERDDKYPAIWAPDLFIDADGSAYVYFAKQKGYHSKWHERTFDIYVSRANDIEKPDFGSAQKISLAGYDNVIDAHVHKLNGRYYMVVKNEKIYTDNDNKSPALFRSDNPLNNFVEVKDWALNAVRGCEGFSIANDNGRIYIYADNYSGKYDAAPPSHHTVWITDDIEHGPFRAEYVKSARPLRHGSVICIDNPIADRVISRFSFETTTDAEISTKTITLERDDYGSGKGNEIIIDKFAPAPSVIYRVPKKTRVIINNLINAYGVGVMEYLLEPGAYIHIDNVLKHENKSKRAMKIILRRNETGWETARE